MWVNARIDVACSWGVHASFLVPIIDLWRALCSGFCCNSSAARIQFCCVANSSSCNSQHLHLEHSEIEIWRRTEVKQWVFLNCAYSRNTSLCKYLIMLHSARSICTKLVCSVPLIQADKAVCKGIGWLGWLVWHRGYYRVTSHNMTKHCHAVVAWEISLHSTEYYIWLYINRNTTGFPEWKRVSRLHASHHINCHCIWEVLTVLHFAFNRVCILTGFLP